MLLVFGVISYGYMLSFRQALSQGAAEGARGRGVAVPERADKETAALDAINDALDVDAYGVTCPAPPRVGLKKDAATVGTCSVTTRRATDPTKDCVTVSLDYATRKSADPQLPRRRVARPCHLDYDATAEVG